MNALKKTLLAGAIVGAAFASTGSSASAMSLPVGGTANTITQLTVDGNIIHVQRRRGGRTFRRGGRRAGRGAGIRRRGGFRRGRGRRGPSAGAVGAAIGLGLLGAAIAAGAANSAPAPAAPAGGRCDYWASRCAANWGPSGPNFRGCMRHYRCY